MSSEQVAANTALDDSFASPSSTAPIYMLRGAALVESERAYGTALLSTYGNGAYPQVFRDAGAAILRLCAELDRLLPDGDAKLSSTANADEAHDIPQEPLATGAE